MALVLLLAACSRGDGNAPEPEFGSSSEGLTVCPKGGTLAGVDVSSYQGSINWSQVAAAGIKWGYAKATESTNFQDPTFGANWSGMKAHGIYRGAYHFFHPNIDGKAQADYFLAYANGIGSGDLPPMLDWEITGGVSGSTAAANAQAFINEIKARIGRETVIYTSPGLWSSFGAPGGFGGDPLWNANWTYSTSSCPSVPSGWSDWVFWQWSDKGSVSGIPATVDLDVFNGSLSDLASFAGGSANSCTNGIAIGHPVGSGGPITSSCSGGGPPALPARPSSCGSMPSGTGLGPGESVASCDGRFVLVMQTDGNAVLYEHGIALWASNTAGKGGYDFVMQGDGNLVLYSNKGCPLWASNTAGHNGASLAIQNDGNVVLYGSSGPLWSTGTGPVAPYSSACGSIPSGDGLGPGDSISSCGGCFNLVMQSDGNLVLYQNGGKALWSTGTSGQHGYAFDMQGDGNAVLYSNSGCPLWSSNTGGHSGAHLAVQDDGNLVIYGSSGAVWASNTVACSGGCSCLPPLAISPGSASVAPRGHAGFSASGGSGGYQWSLSTNASGGSISGGAYTAGASGNVTDTVQVVDSNGHKTTATVKVGPGVSVTPASAMVAPQGMVTLTATGGSGTGYAWSITTAPAHGSISSAGVYTAAATGSVSDNVKVVDSLGNSATATITITDTGTADAGTTVIGTVDAGSADAGTADGGSSSTLSIDPMMPQVAPQESVTFTAHGGSGEGYVWTLTMSGSGGSITSNGLYTAGTTANSSDTVSVMDSQGNVATAQVSVGPGVSITPPMASARSHETVTFAATGGSGADFTWSLPDNRSGGSITSDGIYAAGRQSGVTDRVQVQDSLGNTATATVSVTGPQEGSSDVQVHTASGCGCGSGSTDGLALGALALGRLVWRRRSRVVTRP